MRSKTKRPKLARRKTKLGLPDLITPSQPSPSLPSSNLPYKNSAPNHFADSNSFVIACHTRWRGTFKRIFFSIVSEIGVDTMQPRGCIIGEPLSLYNCKVTSCVVLAAPAPCA